MSLPDYAVDFRGFPACPCQTRWIPLFERELQRRKLLVGPLRIYQLIGGYVGSGGTHTDGGAADFLDLLGEKEVWVARQMGADATWTRPFNWDGAGGIAHNHSVLRGCPHNGPARYQIDAVDDDYNGLGTGGRGAPDDGPRPLSGRTWREGIAWAREQRQKEEDVPRYSEWSDAEKEALASNVADEVLQRTVKVIGAGGKAKEITVKQALARIANGLIAVREDAHDAAANTEVILTTLDEMNS